MNTRFAASSPLHCPRLHCPGLLASPKSTRIVQKGFFYRKSDGKRVTRYTCLHCKKTFSTATSSPCYRQKKRHINSRLFKFLVSGGSQRRAALVFQVTRNTVARKFLFLAQQARLEHEKELQKLNDNPHPIKGALFDEMESFERSKLLPLSIPLVVSAERKILGFKVCSMPAKGLLAKKSRQKYGKREDQRPKAVSELWEELKPYLSQKVVICSDENPKYPRWIQSHLPQATHQTYRGRRGCVVGQGELKSGGFDPLFALNHTAAMLRANINRLFRRTWNTTKLKERLEAHIMLYVVYHNRVLTA